MVGQQAAPPGATIGLKVAIVGGSLAGCAAAIALQRVGCAVTVYERSRGKLEDRGAGIGMPLALLHTLIERDFVDATMAHLPVTRSPFVLRTSAEPEGQDRGRLLWEQPIAAAVTNWGIVYRHLRSRIPETVYHQGLEVTALSELDNAAIGVHLADGQTEQFDLVVCADGQQSVGRHLLFPTQALQYVGYVLWRGLAEEQCVGHIELLEDRVTWAVSESGYCLLYLVPSRTEEVAVGRRQVNWVWYEKVTATALPGVLTDAQGIVHPTSLPPGVASAAQVTYIHQRARHYLPGYVADVVCATAAPFIQAVFDLSIPHYTRGRLCLIGDASTLCRPHAASGAVKALTNALALADALRTTGSLDDALRAWDAAQSAEGRRLVTLGQVMGRAFVQDAPAWQQMDAAAMEHWWTALMREQQWYVTEDATDHAPPPSATGGELEPETAQYRWH
jgi:2-polyprenyl-6-methoxyphenol hydroxylase-like FAD-dependent oxidoreductase